MSHNKRHAAATRGGISLDNGTVDPLRLKEENTQLNSRLSDSIDAFESLQEDHHDLIVIADDMVLSLLSLKESIEKPESEKGKIGFQRYLQNAYTQVANYLKLKEKFRVNSKQGMA